MNVSAIVVSSLLAGMIASAEVPVLGTVKVCVEPGGAMLFIVTQAEAGAGRMFADIGLKIEWLHSRRDCEARPEDTIFIRMTRDSPVNSLPGVLAYAMPYEGAHIVVFYDRIARMADARRQPHLLAHVLAHEVTHILQAVSRHSDEGVMKANWNESDYMQMYWKALLFTPMDVTLIQRGLDARTSRIALQPRP